MDINIQLTSAGVDTDNFTLAYYLSPGPYVDFATFVSRATLLVGADFTIPDGSTLVKITSTGVCTNEIILTINLITTTSTTSTSSTSTTAFPYVDVYGYLYNWYAVDNASNIANTDWHMSTDAEWTTLTDYLIANGYGYGGSGTDIAKSMASTSLWNASGTPGTVGNDQGTNNSSGFNGKPGGTRDGYGIFTSVNSFIAWWTSTSYSTQGAWYRGMQRTMSTVTKDGGYMPSGTSVRLIKDSTSLSHGQTGTYIGNDGTVYATICIGTQEWMSENLKETLYRDLSSIPEVQDNTAWSNNSTGARCYYVI